ncbi:MAG: tyrosine-type recombinase/integrase [Bacillota bacterium]|nr:tyrosine-type recombinase/integrase [Bacillota bacterium]
MSSQYELNGFFTWLTGSGWYAKGTVKAYIVGVTDFIRWFEETIGEKFDPATVTPTDLREYQEHLLTVRRLKPGTINRRVAALRKFFLWAKENSQVADVPRFPRQVREQVQAPKSLTRVEQNRLLRTVERGGNVRDLAIIRIFLGGGLRIDELVSLKIKDLELGERQGKVTVCYGKGMKTRDVPLPLDARRAIKDWLEKHPFFGDASGYLFPNKSGGKLTCRAIQKMLKKYAYQAGLPLHSVHPHALRHTCAKNLLDAGVDLVKVAAILGHESLDTTAIYTKPRFQELSEAVEKGELL